MRSIVWFKKDLRLHDNPALFNACQNSINGVVGVYIIDDDLCNKNAISFAQRDFILRGLIPLRDDLAKLNIPFIVLSVEKTADIPSEIFQLAEKIQATALFFNQELEWNETIRDKAVSDYFLKKNLLVKSYADQFILPFEKMAREQGQYYKVFTPFKRYWLSQFSRANDFSLVGLPKKQLPLTVNVVSAQWETKHSESPVWKAGEQEAEFRLSAFVNKNLWVYDKARDFPFQDMTSKISPYLAVGMISARQCFLAALTANDMEFDTGNQGALTWMSELIWREFYRHILIHVPRVCKNRAYQEETEKLPWRYDEKLLHAWQQGKTGFPLVDAAMRQLNTIGWMHNRLRMVTAMFLSKNLFLDWRLGERYFSEKLIDIDFASNNGGWQWSASTGTDAVPYFRLFNPITQSQRFDAAGDFIRLYCPELSAFDAKRIHDPYAYAPLLAKQSGYPEKVIDYAGSRVRVIAAFKALSGT